MQELQGSVKNLEKAAREGERAANLGSCWDYLQGIGPAIEAYAATAQQAASLSELPKQAVAPQLLEAGRGAVARTSATLVGPVLRPGPCGFRGPCFMFAAWGRVITLWTEGSPSPGRASAKFGLEEESLREWAFTFPSSPKGSIEAFRVVREQWQGRALLRRSHNFLIFV